MWKIFMLLLDMYVLHIGCIIKSHVDWKIFSSLLNFLKVFFLASIIVTDHSGENEIIFNMDA